jgi:ABC-type transport system involved in cytochrome c biogenesis permease subunit
MSMGALMAAYFLPAQLDSSISNKMAALNDVWLYIHTNMIIWSYAIIGLACIPALLLLRHRWVEAWDSGAIPKLRLFILPAAFFVLNLTAYKLLMHAIAPEGGYGLSQRAFIGTAGALWGSLVIVILEAMAGRARAQGGGRIERSASGGAAALIGLGAGSGAPASAGGGSPFLVREKPTANQVFDGATMVLVELSFIMLWTGIVMGAIWADHSWGRPWGWDPKEVFALNTFIVFMVLIHVRQKVKDRSFWTAVLAVVGFEVMMFNWIVVNFVITGLHSYA